MKSKELRIGNWIKDRGSKEWQIDCWESKNKVAAKTPVLGYCDFTKNQIEGHPLTEEMDYLQPILITEDWLLKFGFDNDQSGLFKKYNSWFELINISNKYFRGYYRKKSLEIDIVYIHQLQNLYFALTQTELTIK